MKLLISSKEKFFLLFVLVAFGFGLVISENKLKNGGCKLPELRDGEEKLVTKVLDGDTFLIEGGHSVRILGIDADEKGYPCAEEARRRLEELVLGKKVKLLRDKENFDQYCRYLRYPILNGENLGLKLLNEGLVVKRGEGKFQKEFLEAEERARAQKRGCKWKEGSWTKPEKISACESEKFLGQEKIVEGNVISVFKSKRGNLFLNLEKDYPQSCLQVVIFKEDLKKFPPDVEKLYQDRLLKISGKIKEYKGKPEIIVSDPDQIKMLK